MAKTNHGETQELPTEEKIEYNPTEENEENVDLITGENKDETELDLYEPSVIHVNEDNSEESLNWNMIKKKVETYRNQLKKGKYAVDFVFQQSKEATKLFNLLLRLKDIADVRTVIEEEKLLKGLPLI
ncbi:unnamed protein product [Rhizophagus irregularis]|nr:unnamed protein product [Rhizophagus irregularis]CAB5359984.1 unnamed protein product [Rhizophagus irregularis]